MLCSGAAPWSCVASGVGIGAGEGGGRFSRQAPRQGASGKPLGRARERRILGQESRRRLAGAHDGVPHEPAQERQVGDEALDLGLVERMPEPLERLLARPSVGDQLRDHRVVADPDLVALLDAGVDPDRLGQPQPLDPARLREERLRVLGVEAHLDGVSLERRRHVIDVLALRDADLLLDEIDPRDRLGDGMLDLDASVQLEEIEVVAVRA